MMSAALSLAVLNLVPATLPTPDLSAVLRDYAFSPIVAEAPSHDLDGLCASNRGLCDTLWTSTAEALPTPVVSTLPQMAAFVEPRAIPEATDGQVVEPPHGFKVMCATDLELCGALAASNPGPVEHDTAAQMRLLETVNHEINKVVRQASDMETTGTEDMWRRTGTARDAAGDCEDIAIEKRLMLIKAGFPAEDLYFAVGYHSGIGLHAVLVAHTPGGDIVLDSRTAALSPWRKAPYTWVSMQTPGNPGRWVDPQPLLSTTNRMLAMSGSGTTAALND